MRCSSGGTGRRAGLKIRWPQGRVGSIPSSSTNLPSGFFRNGIARQTASEKGFQALDYTRIAFSACRRNGVTKIPSDGLVTLE
jgi:hypothetical protein